MLSISDYVIGVYVPCCGATQFHLMWVLAIPGCGARRLPVLGWAEDVLRLTARECQQKGGVRQRHPGPQTISGLAHKSEIVPGQSYVDLLGSFCLGVHDVPQCRFSIPEVSVIIYDTLRING